MYNTANYTAGTRSNNVTVTIGTGNDDGSTEDCQIVLFFCASRDDVQFDIESVISGTGNDHLTGNGLNNVLTGGNGDDEFDGGSGDDLLSGALPNETTGDDDPDDYDGEGGTDTVTYSNLLAGNLTITLDNNNNDGLAGGNDNVRTSNERVQGGPGNDSINASGAPAGVALFGNDGTDNLVGSPFNDSIDGGNGSDTADCGAGTDIFTNVEFPTNCP